MIRFKAGAFFVLIALMATLTSTLPVEAQKKKGGGGGAKPTPDLANVKYGTSGSQVFDFWKAKKASEPAPLLVFIHGGGWHEGNKGQLPAELCSACLDAGFAVASIEYRFPKEAIFPAPFHDCARAVQFMRSKAKDYNIDPERIALSGNSAGGCMSLWIGFHDDLADTKSNDPVLKQSTRVSCMYVVNAQSSCDPEYIAKTVGIPAGGEYFAKHQLFGKLSPEDQKTEKAKKLFQEASPIQHLNEGDPPAFLAFSGAKNQVHNPAYGKPLKDKMDALKIECIYRPQGTGEGDKTDEAVKFMKKYLVKKKE